MATRRTFLQQTLASAATLSLMPMSNPLLARPAAEPRISLAQWSLNRAIKNKTIQATDFAAIARRTYQIDAVEYVNGFYQAKKSKSSFWAEMLDRSQSEGVANLLIMVDEEGDLGNPKAAKRKKAVENHYGWVDAAKALQCHSIRVNAFGTGEREVVKAALVDGMGQLCAYGAEAGIHIVIENHGLYSSEADLMVEVIREVDSPYMGTLPDFGNWCTSEKWGATRDDSCENVYNIVEGIQAFLPYAKGVSAKSYDFDAQGDQPRLDYRKLLQVVKDFGYEGYIGIEYEGENLSEPDGIRATKALIEKVWATLD